MVDERGTEYEQAAAVANITTLLAEREQYYKDHDDEVNTDDKEQAIARLKAIWNRIYEPAEVKPPD